MAHPLAGKPAPSSMLINVAALERAYYDRHPNVALPEEKVAFGTSGHRGSALRGSFNEDHIVAITAAICDYRAAHQITGPVFVGADTHALSAPAQRTALEVLVARGVSVVIARDEGYTPTPVISRTILRFNQSKPARLADGIVITPSHNPPEDGGFKYDPPHGGPAETDVTSWIEACANELVLRRLDGVKRIPYEQALSAATTHRHDYLNAYVRDLDTVVDMETIRSAGI